MSAETTGKYLAFDLGGQCFAVEVARVEVVLETPTITRVPKAPPYLRGVINHRGTVIPVADLRTRFGEAGTTACENSSIIILRVRYGQDELTVGMLADGVREVIELDAGQVESPPQVGISLDDAIIAGIGEIAGEFVIVLDIDEAFRAEAIAVARGAEKK